MSFADSAEDGSLEDLTRLSKDADIIAFNPNTVGKNSPQRLSEILEKSPNVKGLALNSTNIDCIDKQYCKERNITVTVVPNHATTQAVAEQIMLLLLGSAKKIFVLSAQQETENTF